VEELKQTIVTEWKTYRNVLLTVVSMNGVVVLNVLSRMAVGISNIAISLSISLGCATGFYFVVVDWTTVKSIKRIHSIDFSSSVCFIR